jgi:hypothetical protein
LEIGPSFCLPKTLSDIVDRKVEVVHMRAVEAEPIRSRRAVAAGLAFRLRSHRLTVERSQQSARGDFAEVWRRGTI